MFLLAKQFVCVCPRLGENWRGVWLLPWTSWRWDGSSDLDKTCREVVCSCLEKFELWNVQRDVLMDLWVTNTLFLIPILLKQSILKLPTSYHEHTYNYCTWWPRITGKLVCRVGAINPWMMIWGWNFCRSLPYIWEVLIILSAIPPRAGLHWVAPGWAFWCKAVVGNSAALRRSGFRVCKESLKIFRKGSLRVLGMRGFTIWDDGCESTMLEGPFVETKLRRLCSSQKEQL